MREAMSIEKGLANQLVICGPFSIFASGHENAL
jgi:hypothetical protein